MRSAPFAASLVVVMIFGWAMAQEPARELVAVQPGPLFEVAQAKQKDDKKDKKTAPPAVDFAELPERAEAPSGLNPHMIGDFPGLAALVMIPVPSLATETVTRLVPDRQGQLRPQTTTRTFTVNVPRTVRVPIAGRGGFKVADNQSVLPQDRSYFTYNYFSTVRGPGEGSGRPFTINQSFSVPGPFGPGTVATQIQVPGVAPPRFDVHRETIGFEKTLFDGAFSIGMRAPMFQQDGPQEFSDYDVGDLTIIGKWAPYRDRETGSGISVGVAVTAPTGVDVPLPDGDLHSTLIQPFVGYQWNRGRVLLYGFTSVVVPTDDRDVTLLFNDVGLGYRLWQGEGALRSVVPALEAHVTTPLDNRGQNEAIRGTDLVIFTGGVHLGVGQRSLLTFGVAAQANCPRTFDVEAILQFNFRF